MSSHKHNTLLAMGIAETLFPALARAIVVHPDELKVTVLHGTASSSVTATPHPMEAGTLIGKGGRTVRAMQLIAKLAGERYGHVVKWQVACEKGENPPQFDRRDVTFDKPWKTPQVKSLLVSTLSAFLYLPPSVGVVEDSRLHTLFEVVLDEAEPATNTEDDSIADALEHIFNAVGKLCGKTVGVAWIRRSRPMEQPQRADGKYAKELW